MPIKIKPNERKDDFIQRCISEEMGYGRSESQSVGMCYSYWEENRLSKMNSQGRYLNALKGISLNPTQEELKAPCTDGYEQYGMKIKNGMKVPNCIPQKS